MNGSLTTQPTANATLMLAAAHRGSNAAVWIVGWIVVLALIGAAVVYLTRRGRPRPGHSSPGYRQPSERHHGS